jgi:hypothetical protein
MIELLKGFPPYVAAYKAQGTISREQYEQIVIKRADQITKEFKCVNFLVLVEMSLPPDAVESLLECMKTSYKCERMAIVSNEKWVRRAYETLRPLFHGEIVSYPISQFYTAKEWVCVEPGAKNAGQS